MKVGIEKVKIPAFLIVEGVKTLVEATVVVVVDMDMFAVMGIDMAEVVEENNGKIKDTRITKSMGNLDNLSWTPCRLCTDKVGAYARTKWSRWKSSR